MTLRDRLSGQLARLREYVAGAPAEVCARDTVPRGHGEVVTVRFTDTHSPTGWRYRTEARWPDGTLAERRWATFAVDAEAKHDGVFRRQARRTIPEHE